MIQAPVYNKKGEKLKEAELNPAIFNVRPNSDTIKQALEVQLANRRKPIAATKDRSEVRGGGRKPWRQKGTGRARHGSTRSPIWIGGGVTFGPRPDRNFRRRMSQPMRQKAVAMALSERAKDHLIKILDSLDLEKPKTRDLNNILKLFKVTSKKVLLIIPASEKKAQLAARNLPNLKLVLADSLNVYDILWSSQILIVAGSLPLMEKTYSIFR